MSERLGIWFPQTLRTLKPCLLVSQRCHLSDNCVQPKQYHKDPRLPTTITLIGFMKSTRDFTLQKPGQPFFKWSWKSREERETERERDKERGRESSAPARQP